MDDLAFIAISSFVVNPLLRFFDIDYALRRSRVNGLKNSKDIASSGLTQKELNKLF
jgi:hypothetical protein